MIEGIPVVNIEYDSSHSLSYGYWRCRECDNSFYGGGEALHKNSCSQSGYDSCNYCYGDAEIKRIKSYFVSFGLEGLHGCWTELAILRKHTQIEKLDEKVEVYRSKLLAVKDAETATKEADAMKQFLIVH